MTTTDNVRITDAIAQIRAGGRSRERGVRLLFEHCAGQLRRYFVRHRVTDSESEELVQEVFIRVIKGCENFRGDAPASVWLWTIARNILISHHRQRRPDALSIEQEQEDGLDLLSSKATHDTAPWIQDCLKRQMTRFASEHPERADCISAIVLQDWGTEELATFLDRSLAATKEYLSQCRKKLRTYLDECAEGESES